MQKIKVVHIITKMELGGAQQNTLFTVSNLNPQKYEIYLLTGPDGELMDEAKKFKGLFIVKDLNREIRPFKDINAFFQIVKILKKLKAKNQGLHPLLSIPTVQKQAYSADGPQKQPA